MSKEITSEPFTYLELVETIAKTSIFPFAAISYLIGYASYLLLTNIILSLSIWGLLTLLFVLYTAKKALNNTVSFGPTHWTFTTGEVTIKNKLISITIPTQHVVKVSAVTPNVYMISFKHGIQSRIIKTSNHSLPDINSLLTS